MGVYIKGMNMPKGCHEAPHGYVCPYLLNCKVNREYVEKTGKAAINKRLDGCPLVEVAEPHGRLIDTDMLQHMIDKTAAEPEYQHTGEDWMVGLYIVKSLIDELLTVIESEE